MGAVRLPGNGVQLFDIAVVRSDGHHVVLGQGSIHHLLQGPADVTAGIQLGGGVLGVADDITVGEVGDDEVVFPQGARHSPGHLRQGELRLLVKVDAFGRGDAHILFTGEGGVFPAVEEKGHMGELLGLRAVELGFSGLGEDLGQRFYHVFRRKGDGQMLELVVIQCQDSEVQILQLPALHGPEVVRREQFRQLDLPLTPAAAEHHRVVIPDAADGNAALSQHHGLQMIVVLPCGIGMPDGLCQLGTAVIGYRHQKTSPRFQAAIHSGQESFCKRTAEECKRLRFS